jgi:CheY-like chemotaxis protein
MNLLNNALEAMPAGGDIFITTADMYVDIYLEGFENIPEGEYICISISDTGVGIPQRDLKQIFEPFYTKKSMHHSGTGLGMTIVWATIKDHKGYIDIQSEEGIGTTFKVYLPTTREIIPAEQRRLVLDDYLGSEALLIVDDIPEQLDIARNMLTKLGYTVYSAASGEKALEAIKRQPVDLVILDMIMPGGLDGLETYQQIIQLYPHQKAIITSGFSESDRVRKLLHLGVGNYVQKPYTMEKLGMTVRVELDRKNELYSR